MDNNPIISTRSVTKRFPGVTALADVTLDVRAGELHAICGENGAGKSTLMKILSGVIADYEGEFLLAGRAVRFKGTRDAEAAGISIIHQELNLVEQLSAAANIFLGREIRGWLVLRDDRAMEQAAARLLKELECEIDPRQTAGSMRVGDQQLIEIAKALSLQSDILIMDEPTSALTEAEVSRLYRVIERLRKRGVTILYISHKMDEVFHLADRITVLRDGRLVKTLVRSATNPQEVTHLMVGREIEAVDFGNERKAGEVLLSVENLSLPWPGHARGWRLKDVSFELRRGEVLGIAGLMGAGRTELMECLFGAATEPPQGRIELAGQSVMFRHPREACAAGIALVTEDRKRLGLFPAMNVGENISICTLQQTGIAGFINRSREWEMAAATSEKLAVKMSGLIAPVTSLSGGNQQKCIIGRWLQTQPRVLLLDDPTRGVDVGAKAELYRLIDGLVRQGIGVIMTSSELPELLTVCDRILVLSEGRLTASFTRNEATEQKIMEAATLGAGRPANNFQEIVMDYRLLGRTGVRISPLCLGTMMFGGQTTEADSIRIVHKAIDLGINFVDTADMYVAGESEKIVGKAIAERRDRVVLATKGRNKMGEGPNDWGTSRLHMRQALDASLKRLNTAYIDLYYIHSPDYGTPIDETLRFLDDAVRQGKILYSACSNFRAWSVCEGLWTSDKLGLARFAAVQPLYNLVNRDIEVELLPLCKAHGLGVVSYSPLARGILTAKYKPGEAFPEGSRAARNDKRMNEAELREESLAISQQLGAHCKKKGVAPSQFALAWCLANPIVTSIILGPRTMEQFDDNIAALQVKITAEDESFVDKLVPPGEHSGKGFRDPNYPVIGRPAGK